MPHGYPPPNRHPRPGHKITYVPAHVIVPGHPRPPRPPHQPSGSTPTIVNNYYYQQPPAASPTPAPAPAPVPVFQPLPDPIDWMTATPSTASAYTHRAYTAGKEGWDGSPLWVIRAHYSGEFVPGKLAIKHKAAYIPHNGKEIPVHNFEILLAHPSAVVWLPSSNGQVPRNAIPAGNSHIGEPLYIGRVPHMKSITPGKVHPSHHCCYISFGDSVLWMAATRTTAAEYADRALVAGHEGWDGSPLCIIRALHNGALLPGKLAIKHKASYVPFHGKEVGVDNFQILLADPDSVQWLPSSNGRYPHKAIPAGFSDTGEILYICRVPYQKSTTPGLLHPSRQNCYISFRHQEISFKDYEVLCNS